MNSISLSGASKEQKTCSQKKGNSKDRKIQAQMELIEKQKWESENLKAAQATEASSQQLVSAISQECLSSMWAPRRLQCRVQVMVERNL